MTLAATPARAKQNPATKDRVGHRLDSARHHGIGHRQILQADAGAVEQRDLIRRSAARMSAVGDRAQLADIGLGQRGLGYRVLGFAHGEAVASVSVSGPTGRMPDDRIEAIAALVKDAAATVSRGLGARLRS